MKNCPKCGALLKERQTHTKAVFLVCTRWPHCKVSGTPDLLSLLEKPQADRDPIMPMGEYITMLAQLRILQSKMKNATAEERASIRQQAKELLKRQFAGSERNNHAGTDTEAGREGHDR